MSDNDIKKSYERSAQRMRGDQQTFAASLTKEDYNDPALHEDIHERISIDYTNIDKMSDMEEVHRWQ